MAMTLFEASKRVSAEVKRGAVIEMFARNSQLVAAMPFEDVPGGSYSYDLEAKLPGVGFRGINEGYSETTGVIAPQVEVLRFVGGDLDVDKALIKTRGAGIRATEEAMKVKTLSLHIADRVINGDSVSDPREFDGLRRRVVGPQLFPANLAAPLANSPLSLEALDAALDQVDGPNALAMNKAVKRKLKKAARANLGGDIRIEKNDFGFSIEMYDDYPILIVDYNEKGQRSIDFNEVGPGGGATSTSLYVLHLGDSHVMGLQNGTMEVSDLGEIDAKPVLRTRLEWIVGMAVMHGRAVARIWGITNADVTA